MRAIRIHVQYFFRRDKPDVKLSEQPLIRINVTRRPPVELSDTSQVAPAAELADALIRRWRNGHQSVFRCRRGVRSYVHIAGG